MWRLLVVAIAVCGCADDPCVQVRCGASPAPVHVDVTVPDGVTVTIAITRSDGVPVRIECWDLACTAAEAWVDYPDPPVGDYHVEASAPGYVTATADVTVPAPTSGGGGCGCGTDYVWQTVALTLTPA